MKKRKFTWLVEIFKYGWQQISLKPILFILILLALPIVFFIVYYTGGIKYVYSHTMYIAIILAGIYYGPAIATFVALSAGILLGPIMPINTETGEMQDPINWLYRLLLFLIIANTIGYSSRRLQQDKEQIETLLSTNPETMIPNTNTLRSYKFQSPQKYSIGTVIINNYRNIIEIIGIESFHTLMKNFYQNISSLLPKKASVVQSDSNKLWIISPETFEQSLERITIINHNSYIVGDIPVYIDLSIGGYTLDENNSENVLDLFISSDASATYAQKNFLLYAKDQPSEKDRKKHLHIVSTFMNGLHNKELYLVFQPKINIEDQSVSGFEALIRWQHSEHGMIPPTVFIPLLEETKLIHVLTDFVVSQTLEMLNKLKQKGYELPISINLSAKSVSDPDFFIRTMRLIDQSHISHRLIEFELTETSLMVNPKTSVDALQLLRNNGFNVHLDDFGKGYSSLSYLLQFPITSIKIDRFFIMHMLTDNVSKNIVETTINLAKKLDCLSIAEGIETKEMYEALKLMKCDFGQGYYFAKPMIDDDVLLWLTEQKNKTFN